MTTEPISTATTVLAMAQAERFAELREMFAPQVRDMVSADALQIAWTAELGRRGRITAIGTPIGEPAGAGTVAVKIPVSFEHGAMTVIVAVVRSGALAGLQLVPAGAAEPIAPWEPPAYADPRTFDEQDVALGSGPLAVPAALSLPRQPVPSPAVVLLGGSGPADRDETIGRNKPFKDLAWGLAGRGIAVLRFDKVTVAHPGEVGHNPDFTVIDEYLHHAVAAIHLLRQHPAVDATRIFLLGHSLGGTVAPRVAAAEPVVAGLVILAGGTQPLHWAAVRQVSYLASLEPGGAAASRSVVDAMTRQAEMVDSAELSASTPVTELPFGVPAAYWLDLRGYHPVELAATLGKPILVLQGGRDYQVTVADDLTRWRVGLADKPEVSFRVYDRDNPMFFPGSGTIGRVLTCH